MKRRNLLKKATFTAAAVISPVLLTGLVQADESNSGGGSGPVNLAGPCANRIFDHDPAKVWTNPKEQHTYCTLSDNVWTCKAQCGGQTETVECGAVVDVPDPNDIFGPPLGKKGVSDAAKHTCK